jgi:phospholipase C
MKITRRDALKSIGALAGAAALPRALTGCGGSTGSGPGSTMVFMMMENRTYDHILGSRSLVEGLPGDGLPPNTTNLDASGNPIASWVPSIDTMHLCVQDPPHDWDSSRAQDDAGANDGFVKAFQAANPGTTGDVVMQYMTRDIMPVTYALADAYTSCDRWFSSLLGPTLPNRMYWMAATSNGAKSNSEVLGGAFNGIPHIFSRLDAAGIDWGYYYGDVPVLGFVSGIDPTRIRRFMYRFIDDAAAGKLPQVVFIDPMFLYNDDHPPHYPLLGQQLISAAYTALSTGPQWDKSLFVLTYDEHGGFYDHVAPGKAADERASDGFDQLGFRVPALVMGPHVKAGAVCSDPLEHTSALKHIETAFGLEPLSMRDAAAMDLSGCLDPTASNKPITPPVVEVDESMLMGCSGSSLSSIRRPHYDHDILKWADAHPLGKLDLRSEALQQVYEIAEYLDKHNLGRIRRGR